MLPCYGIVPGLNVCTCRGKVEGCKPGKHPWCQHGFYDATDDPAKIKKWYPKFKQGANLAVRTGAGLLTLDFDLYKPGVAETLAALESEYGQIPRDWMQRTHGDGRHLVFTLPDGIHVKSQNDWRPGIDIRCNDGYILVWPSRHISGELYEWLSEVGDKPPMIPQAWLPILPDTDSPESASPPASRKPALSNWHKRTPNKSAQHVEQPTHTDNTDNSDNYSIVSGLSVLSVCSPVREKIIEAINMTFPRRESIRNLKLMELGRWLFRIEELQEKDAEWFRPVIKLWLDLAQQWIGPREFEETWAEWLSIWTLWVSKSIDEHPVFKAAELMKKRQTPPLPPNGYRSDNARRLVALCAALSEVAADGDGVFFVSCRDAARVIGLDPEEYCRFVGSVFRQMVKDGILEKIGEHVQGSMRAQRYKYHPYTPAPATSSSTAA